MQQTYAGKDIVRFIAAILWMVMGIIYLTYVFKIFDFIDKLNQEKINRQFNYGYYNNNYNDYYNKSMSYCWILNIIFIAAVLIAIIAAVYLFKEDLEKFGIAMYCYATGFVLVVVGLIIYLNVVNDGEYSLIDSYFVKYIFVLGIAFILFVSSVYAEGVNYKKADRGEFVGTKSFLPLGLYLSYLICILIFSSMLSDFGVDIKLSDLLKIDSHNGLRIAINVGIHISCGLYLYLKEKYYAGAGAYGGMGYGTGGYGIPPYGASGYGVPPYGQAGYGQTPYGNPMGVAPGMYPMGMIPPQPKSNLELTKEQSEREFILKKGGWICYNCKKANYSYVGSCACGMTRDESERKEKEDKDKAISEMQERISRTKEKAESDTQGDTDGVEFGKEVKAGSVLEASTLGREKNTWECLACHIINSEDAKSCKNCGQIKALGYKNVKVSYCPSCGATVEGSSKFCFMCGCKLS